MPIIRGFNEELKENLFSYENPSNAFDNNLESNKILNENIFKNKKYSEIHSKKLRTAENVSHNKGLMDILQNKNWGNSNKPTSSNFENSAGTNTYGKIYRDLGNYQIKKIY